MGRGATASVAITRSARAETRQEASMIFVAVKHPVRPEYADD
jgi:hypothetical protein